MERVNIAEKFARFAERWRPKIVAELNGQEVKLVKVQGTFPWHHHDDVDEMFLVWRGRFRVEFRDRIVELGPGELIVVPRGVEHRTAADEEAEVILLEPAGILNAGILNTGNVIDETFTAADEEAEVILLEPAGILNTGNVIDETFTAPTGARI